MSLPISRRRLLTATVSAGVSALALAGAGPARAASAIELTAGRRTLDVDGRAASVFGITQPDGTSGLYAQEGAPFLVTLRNELGQDTLVHWHGLAPPYRQDGVPGVSASAVPTGDTASYDFPLDFPGTFWMHSHQGLQEQSLLTAPLIVRPRGAADDRQEVVLILHDFSFRSPSEIYAGLRHAGGAMKGMGAMPGMAMGSSAGGMAMGGSAGGRSMGNSAGGGSQDLNDVAYDAFLANDRTLGDPQVVRVESRGRILLRIINAAAASNFRIDLGPVPARLVAVDGRAVRPVAGATFPIAIAQRLDLALELPPDQPVLPVFATLEGERARTGIVLATAAGRVTKLAAPAPAAALPLGTRLEQALRAASPLLPKPADRVHRVDLTGAMESYVWSLNGRVYGQDSPLMVAKGERVELVMANRTMMSHPMHLHGHAFQVVAIDGQRFSGALRDTVLVPPMRSVTVAFDADNPGRWAFHCHNLYHMEAGMMTTVQYDRF